MSDIQAIIVVATYGSGSTALTGFLNKCGVYTCPPHQSTNDERTPSAYEPVVYAKYLRNLIDEKKLEQKGSMEVFKDFFESFWHEECKKAKINSSRHIALKHPLQTFILPYLNNRIKPKYLFVTRPVSDIEKTRLRRGWHPIFGKSGANIIYPAAMNFFVSNSIPYLSVPYKHLLNNRNFRKDVLNFCNLKISDDALRRAETFLSSELPSPASDLSMRR